jgi:hypothetical protein
LGGEGSEGHVLGEAVLLGLFQGDLFIESFVDLEAGAPFADEERGLVARG